MGGKAPKTLEKYRYMRYNNTEEYRAIHKIAADVKWMNMAKANGSVIYDKNIPILTTPDSAISLIKDGELYSRCYFDKRGRSKFDLDNTDHKNPTNHPIVPHQHSWAWYKAKKTGELKKSRSKYKSLTKTQEISNSDLEGIRHE
ncbi:hypothetical protein Q7W32_06570 [Streptococcus suis]|nr:hypothetical protein [Streptococcus suis]